MQNIYKKAFFIGCEPYLNGVANLISILDPNDFNRIKIYETDVRWLLDIVPENFFSKIIMNPNRFEFSVIFV